MSNHTPGPWGINGGKTYTNEISAKSPRGKIWVIARTTGSKVGREQDNANAHLIAAAPELLAALKLALSFVPAFTTADFGAEAARQIRAAIAKAEGRAE